MNTNYNYIVADHIRSACFIIADGVLPSPKQRGYIVRRLIRRALLASTKLHIDILNKQYFEDLVDSVISIYKEVYTELAVARETIIETLLSEAKKFDAASKNGKKEWEKYFSNTKNLVDTNTLTTKSWDLYQSFGVPFEISEQEVELHNHTIDTQKLHSLIEEHQQKSAQLSAGQFKSGLAGDSSMSRRLHTVTHLLHAALRSLYGNEVRQVGSAITDQKARFDITLTQELADNDRLTIQTTVQKMIDAHANIQHIQLSQDEARKLGAVGLFGEKYPDVVTIYTITKPDSTVLSREFCSGPHVENTQEVGKFEIIKIKSIGQGRKRLEYKLR